MTEQTEQQQDQAAKTAAEAEESAKKTAEVDADLKVGVNVGDPGNPAPAPGEQQPTAPAHDVNATGPASAPPAEAQSGDPLDASTKRALNPDLKNDKQGESTPSGE